MRHHSENNLRKTFKKAEVDSFTKNELMLQDELKRIKGQFAYDQGHSDAENGDISGYRMETDDDYYAGAKADSEYQEEDFGRITNL